MTVKPLKVIIAGSRHINDEFLVAKAILLSGFIIGEVVCGEAPGVDTLGRQWAEQNGIPVASFPADWKRYRMAAGPIRNAQMGDYADAAICVWDGDSTGTKNMIGYMKKLKKPCFVCNLKDPNVDLFDSWI